MTLGLRPVLAVEIHPLNHSMSMIGANRFSQLPAAPGQAAPAIVAAKPRLVAKLGKDARLSLISPSIGVAGGPDASKVWNKNKRKIHPNSFQSAQIILNSR